MQTNLQKPKIIAHAEIFAITKVSTKNHISQERFAML